jgi:glycosyltransferase involved in cell wall biosynthesis
MEKNNCVIIPAYNEEENLDAILNDAINHVDKVIVVDDGSIDNTADIAESYSGKGVITLLQGLNCGKADALKRGINYAVSRGYDTLVTMDSDGQHLPSEIPLLLNKMGEGYDLVIGKRNFAKMPLPNRIANIIDASMVSFLAKQKIYDSQSGFRAINSRLFKEKRINLSEPRFTMESQFIIEAALNNYRIGFADISTVYLDGRKSKIKIGQQIKDYARLYSKYMFKGKK